MTRFNVPERKYVSGPRKLTAWRLPEIMLKEIEKVSKAKGWKTSELVVTIIDQYLQWEKDSQQKAKR